MHSLTKIYATRMDVPELAPTQSELMVEELRAEQQPEVIEFLNERPAYTFGMTGFIRTNGLVSTHNRGSFYGCRDKEGRFQGVALIGHYILFETRSDAAIEAIARLSLNCRNAHMLLGEEDKVQTFWHYYADAGQHARLYCREMLLEQSRPIEVTEPLPGLRLANIDDLELVVPPHAQLAFEESGVDPLANDPEGFRRRCARRVEQGQTWVWVEDGKLMFKADVIADTPEVAYLEGVWVDPSERGKGYGLQCISKMSKELLMRSASVCVLVNEKLSAAQRFYRNSGYKPVGNFSTIFLS